jgi:hypothetical protein
MSLVERNGRQGSCATQQGTNQRSSSPHDLQTDRRIATRYDKLAAHYLAFIKLASIRIWLRAHESTPQTDQILGVSSSRQGICLNFSA